MRNINRHVDNKYPQRKIYTYIYNSSYSTAQQISIRVKETSKYSQISPQGSKQCSSIHIYWHNQCQISFRTWPPHRRNGEEVPSKSSSGNKIPPLPAGTKHTFYHQALHPQSTSDSTYMYRHDDTISTRECPSKYSHNLFSDQPDEFPVTSSKWNKYSMVMFGNDSNTILAEPMKNRHTNLPL